jgi:hypothetical protein
MILIVPLSLGFYIYIPVITISWLAILTTKTRILYTIIVYSNVLVLASILNALSTLGLFPYFSFTSSPLNVIRTSPLRSLLTAITASSMSLLLISLIILAPDLYFYLISSILAITITSRDLCTRTSISLPFTLIT